jgi:hypothetical protein
MNINFSREQLQMIWVALSEAEAEIFAETIFPSASEVSEIYREVAQIRQIIFENLSEGA